MSLETLQIETGELQENCYILWETGRTDAIVFDPGADPEVIEAALKEHGLNIAIFLQTHCHFDHIGALTDLKAKYPAAPIHVPEAEESWMQRPTLNLSFFFGHPITAPNADHLVKENDVIEVAGLSLKAILVPGHSPGSTCYFVSVPNEKPHVFSGDTLFCGGIGRTDLPGGSGEEALIANIQTKLFVLPDNTIVHPGHGPETQIGREKKVNPYCRAGI